MMYISWNVHCSNFVLSTCWLKYYPLTLPMLESLLFFSLQVYVQVNKAAEHDEDIKQAARRFFRQLEQQERQAVSLWQQFREITVAEYQHVYKVQLWNLKNTNLMWDTKTCAVVAVHCSKRWLSLFSNPCSGWGSTLTCTAGSLFTRIKLRRWCGSCRVKGCWEPPSTSQPSISNQQLLR